MNILDFNMQAHPGWGTPVLIKAFKIGALLTAICWLWPLLQGFVFSADPTRGFIDGSIWLLVMIGLACFGLIVGIAWWLLNHFWFVLGLPDRGEMVSRFNTLELWQQLSFFWLSFALLLLAGLGCLAVVC
ncbi:hypothetical protein [Pedobacter faecalis]|uniref:hypothetical protein n=1 Tax=Pedobacter faecalis TaxID=3041495 RepID=UPI0025518A3A|nr:hypothetical protein [Pedobacter sp. ELA7]